MVNFTGVEADDKKIIISLTDAVDCIVTTGYWIFFFNLVKLPIGYAHTPYKIVNIGKCVPSEVFLLAQ